ncbi:hypothetical protein EUGRSUZ_C03613 [Eucalyptus grandis]|uniref:Uncharacterized protein n=2 Tax=Eucalyptus grandis TaxID=71139 RepID=A0ACC3LIM1_EUCGR|nr:hypothetical protein EUGRSUZ_C03613 [Eucalyptus grandis]
MPSITSPRRTSPSPPSHQQPSLAFERRQRERRLYEASHDGCVESLAQLLQEDRLILARASVTCFDETPLHVACMQGHVQFAQDLLAHKRDWAMELDSQGRTPLRWASTNGYVEIVRQLLQSNPLACLVHDEDGWTPLHLATMKGRSNIVIELVKARPEAAKHRLSHGQTALHLGVSHNRLEALKVLVETVRDGDLTMKYLLQISEVDMNTMNRNGFSALDIVEYFPKDFKVIELRELLVYAGALRSIRFLALTTHQAVVHNRNEENSTVVVDLASTALPSTNTPLVKAVLPPSFSGKIKKQKGDKHEKWIKKKRDSLMIIATVIAAMAYQAGLSPPCGLWDNNQKDDKGTILYYAGTSILAANNPEGYPLFWLCNTVSLLASLSTIFLLMSGLPLGKKVLMRILTGTMWVTITFMATTYLESMMAISFVHREPKHVSPFTEEWYSEDVGSITVVMYSLFVWLGIVAIVFLVHTVRFLAFVFRNNGKAWPQRARMTTILFQK